MKLRLLKFRSPHGPPPLTRILLVTLVALVFLAVTVRLLYSSHSRHQASRQRQRAHDIFFETEGTTTPWRDWANATHGAAPPTGEAAFLARLRERHGLTRDLPFLGRRIKVEYRKSPGVGSRILGVATGGIKHGGRGGGGGGLDDRPSMTILQDGGAAASLVHGTNWGWRTVRVPEGSIFDSDDRAFLDLRTDPALLRLPMSRSGRDQRRPDTVDASGLVIGVVTTLARLVHADSAVVRDWTRWLTDGKGKSNGAVLALVLKGLDETAYGRRQDLQNVRKRLASVGIDAIVVPVAPTGNVRGRGGDKGKRDDVGSGAGESTTRKGGRVEGDEPEVKVGSYFELIPLLRETANRLEREGKPKRTWLGLVDDEVFLPSMGRLLHKLGAFNPNKEHYVGLPSEKADWVREGDVTTTYGGGKTPLAFS